MPVPGLKPMGLVDSGFEYLAGLSKPKTKNVVENPTEKKMPWPKTWEM